MREPITTSERFAVTMRCYVTGDVTASYKTTISHRQYLEWPQKQAILSGLFWWGQVFRMFATLKTNGKKIISDLSTKWNFPYVTVALDGKHIVMQTLHNSGSAYFNYKKTQSVVFSCFFEFILVDARDSGRQSDGSVYGNSQLGFCIENQKNWIFLTLRKILLGQEKLADDVCGLKYTWWNRLPVRNWRFHNIYSIALRKKCPYSKLFWSIFSRIRTEYGDIRSISSFSVRIRENTKQNNSEYRHFSRSIISYPEQGGRLKMPLIS